MGVFTHPSSYYFSIIILPLCLLKEMIMCTGVRFALRSKRILGEIERMEGLTKDPLMKIIAMNSQVRYYFIFLKEKLQYSVE